MLVSATFLAICIASVLFMLRFLLALDSETKASQPHSLTVKNSEAVLRGRAVDAVPAIPLVHARRPLTFRPGRTAPLASFQHEQSSQYKGA